MSDMESAVITEMSDIDHKFLLKNEGLIIKKLHIKTQLFIQNVGNLFAVNFNYKVRFSSYTTHQAQKKQIHLWYSG